MAIKASSKLRDFIRSKESFRPTPYKDVTGKLTVGYGDTGGSMTAISEAEAIRRLEDRLIIGETELNKHVKRQGLTQEQQDVLLDMEYNLGITKLRKQGFIDLVNNGSNEEIGRAILNYSKAKDAKTGEMKEFPGLRKRAEERAQMWGYNTGIRREPSGIDQEVVSDPFSDINTFEPSAPASTDMSNVETKSESPFADLDTFEFTPNIPFDPAKARSADLAITGQALDEGEVQSRKEARKLSKEEAIPFDEAQALIFEKTPNQVKLERNQDDISKYFPVAAQWAKEMDNYAMLRDNTKTVTKIETFGKSVNPSYVDDIGKALKSNAYMLDGAYTMASAILGGMAPKDAERTIREIDQKRKQNELTKYGTDVKEITKAFNELETAAGKTAEAIADTWDTVWSDSYNEKGTTATKLKAVFDSGVKTADEILSTIVTMGQNPAASTLIGIQSAGSFIPSVVGGVAGGLTGSLAGPAGAAAGVKLGAGAGTALLSFGSYLEEQLEEFRDPNGVLLVQQALSDPARVAKWRNKAAAYGVTMGLIDGVFTGMAGNTLVKPASGNTFLKKAVSKGGQLAKGTAVQAAGEGLGETGATIAAEAVGGDLTPGKAGQAVGKGVTEALASIVPGAGMDIAGAGARTGFQKYNTAKEAIAKTKDKVKKSNEANTAYNTIQEIRKTIEEDKAATDNPDAMADLINRTVSPEPKEDVSKELINDSEINSEIEAEVKNIKEDFKGGTVKLYPSEWNSFANEMGMDPVDAIQSLGTEASQQYINNKEADSAIEVPVGDWIIGTKDMSEADALIRVNNNEMNAIEAGVVSEQLEKDPFSYFAQAAFHGTPYKFDKFSTEKIGTGEGAQAFGYGLYFTEDKDIAEWYRKKLSERKVGKPRVLSVLKMSQQLDLNTKVPEKAKLKLAKALKDYAEDLGMGTFDGMTPEEILNAQSLNGVIADILSEKFDSWQKIANMTVDDLAYTEDISEFPESALQEIRDYAKQQLSQGEGQLYEVDIPEKDQMLDWDASLSQQSDYVKEKLTNIIPRAYKVDQDIKWKSGESLYKLISRQEGGDRKASWFLQSAGIKGIKYAAQSGRSDKQNFVVFNDQDVAITQTFYQPDDWTKIVAGTDEAPGEEYIPPVGDFSGEGVLRPVQLYGKFRGDNANAIYKRILSQLRDTTAWAEEVPKDSLEVIAELEFRHIRSRAELLGKTVDEVANLFSLGMTSKAGVRGSFAYFRAMGHPYKILFNRSADAATMVHEMGHQFLHEMSEDWVVLSNMPQEQLNEKQREYLEVMQIAADKLGIGTMDQLYNRPKAEVTHIHEIFSQTTEMYFLEGKFADSRIKQILEFFRKWMIKIASTVAKAYPEHPPLKVDDKLERLFNVLLDADNKIEEELQPMFTDPLFPKGMLEPKQQAAYEDMIRDARSEAIAEMYGKMLKAPLKEREAMINKALDDFNKQAEIDVDNSPSMRLKADMAKYYAQYKKKQIESDPRISFESFKNLLAEGSDSKAIEMRGTNLREMIATKGKGGVDIEIVMQQMGITDPKEMWKLLEDSTRREELINERVNEMIEKDFPPLKTDKEIHEIAVDALNRAGKEKIINKEFNILIDKFRPQIKVLIEKGMLPAGLLGSKEAKKIMQAKADEILLDSSIAGFNIKRFLTDSDNHGKMAARSFKEGNIVHAFEEKYKQSIHFYAYKKATDLISLLAETKVLQKVFQRTAMDPKKAMSHDIDVMTYGVQIINMFSNGLTALPPLDISAFSDRSGISEDSVELVNTMIRDMAINAKGRVGNATSVRTYLEFGAILKTLLKIAKDAKKVELGGQIYNRDELKAQLIAEVGPRLAKDQGMTITQREAVQNILMGLRPVRAELASLFASDADFEKSVLGKIYNDITMAEAIRNEKLDVQRSKIINAVKEAVKSDSNLAALVRPVTSLVGSTILNSPPKPVRLGNLKITLDNKAELYMFMLYLGSESGAEKLLRGGVKGSGPLVGYNIETNELDMTGVQADIDTLIADGTLTKKDFDMLQTVWDAFDALHPDAVKAIRATDGRNLGYVKGKKISTKWGDYRGGYIPITSDTYLKQQSLESMRSPDNAMYKSSDFYPSMNMDFTNTRTKSYYDVNLDFSRITAKLAGTANVAYLREPLMNIGKVLGSPDVMNAIESRRAGFYEASLIPWFDRTKLQQYSEPSKEFHNKIAKMIRRNANLKFYLGNVLSGVKQYIGLTNAIPLVGAKNISIAAAKFAGAPRATIAFISEQDPRMKQMFESHHINQIKSYENLETNFDWLSASKDKLDQFTFFIIQGMQSQVSATVWMAGYQKALQEGLTDKQAINFATNSVKNSQGSTTVSDMARAQFGTDAWKLFTMFSMVPITGGSEIYKSYMRSGDTASDKKRTSLKFAAAIGAGVFTAAIPALMEAMVSEAAKGGADDEEEDVKKLAKREGLSIEAAKKLKAQKNSELIIKDMAFNFFDQTIPIYGRWAAKPLLYGQLSVSPLLDNVGQDFGAAKRGVNMAEQGVEITAREFAGMMNMLTYGTGLPFTIFGKAVKMDEKSMDKKEKTRRAKQRRIAVKKAKKKRNE